MEWGILILLAYISYAVWKINGNLENKRGFDPDFPFFSVDNIRRQKIEVDIVAKVFEEKDEAYHVYYEANKEKIDKIKRNKEHTQEFKDIIREYHDALGKRDNAIERYNNMIEVNYAIKNSKLTIEEAHEKFVNGLHNKLFKSKKSTYDTWLEHEEK